MPAEEEPVWADEGLRALLEAFARGGEAAAGALPWQNRLSPPDRERLRGELELVLSEPEVTGEPVDWQEVRDILAEWAAAAGWEEALVQRDTQPADGPYSVRMRPRDTEALAGASAAVRATMRTLLAEFLTLHPTAIHLLPRGHLKKLKNRHSWQVELPDGYRLRYSVDKNERAVHVIYLGPHPDRDTSGRERAARLRMQRERTGEEGH